MTLPRDPDQDDETPVDSGRSRRTNVIIAVVVAVLVLIVVLHLTGVIPH